MFALLGIVAVPGGAVLGWFTASWIASQNVWLSLLTALFGMAISLGPFGLGFAILLEDAPILQVAGLFLLFFGVSGAITSDYWVAVHNGRPGWLGILVGVAVTAIAARAAFKRLDAAP